MANRYPDHSDDEAPRSRCSSRSDRESDSSGRDANRARRELASDAARWSRGLLKTGDQRAAPSRGLPIITFTLILLMCAAFLQQQELTILFKKDRWWHLRRWWYPFPFLFLRHMSSLHLAANVFALFHSVRKPHDIRVMLWVNVAVNVLLCEWVEAKLLYSDDRDYSGCGPRPLTRPTPGCPRRVERRARYAAHAGGLLAGAALGYFL